MANLAEAEGAGDFDLLVDEALRVAANRFVAQLGGEIAPYEPLSDAAWSEAYRQKLVMRSLELLHRLERVPDELIRRAIEEHSAAPARRYADGYVAALQEAIYRAGARAATLAVEEATAELPPEPGRPCRGQPCGFLVEWQGRPPNGPNRRFGDAGQLENLVLGHLVGAGYRLERGPQSGGLTLRLRPRTGVGLCDFMSGTDNTGCLVIDNVRVDFLGEYPGYGTPEGFLVRNRCGADGAMAVDGVAAIVALRLHALLAPDPDAEIPRC
jgi:hypothetical protein